MKIIFLLLIITGIYLDLNAQGQAEVTIGDQSIERVITSELDYSSIDGSPYLEKDILSGKIIFADKTSTDQLDLQYDIHSNEFFYVDEKGRELVFSLSFVREIIMDGKEESYLFKRVNPRKPHKFYEVLYESKDFDIYNHSKITFHRSSDNGIVKTEAKFARKDHYFLLRKGEKAEKFKLKKKELFKQFSSESKKQADQLLKQNKIKLKKSKDFKKLFGLMQSQSNPESEEDK